METAKLSKTRNPRMTKREKGLIKGGMRRAFSRSELRKSILEKAFVKEHQDPSRKRVTRWGKCADCGKIEAAYQLEIDHIEPVVPLDQSFDEMSLDEVADRLWCDQSQLQAICKNCHKAKSLLEARERRRIKKLKGIK